MHKVVYLSPIEKGIPLPSVKVLKYPFLKMGVMDSFYVAPKERNSVSACASILAKKNPPLKFTVREVENGYRAWRTA